MIPHYFALDEDAARTFAIREEAGTLVTVAGDGELHTSFLPIMWHDDVIVMHMGRANAQWRSGPNPRPAILVFTGAHGYVSAGAYDLPEGMVSASTWDFTQVTVHGSLTVHDDVERAKDAALRLSHVHEERVADGLTADYLARAARGIIALTFDVERIEGIAKLSQNKLPHERAAIVERLRTDGADALADAIEAVPSTARRVPFKRGGQ